MSPARLDREGLLPELGVAKDASAAEIKKAYRKLARDLHPDTNPGDAQGRGAFKAVVRGLRRALRRRASARSTTRPARCSGGGGGFAAAASRRRVRHRRTPAAGFDLERPVRQRRAAAARRRRRARRPVRRPVRRRRRRRRPHRVAAQPRRGADVETEVTHRLRRRRARRHRAAAAAAPGTLRHLPRHGRASPAPPRAPARSATAPAWSPATRARSRSPSRAATAAAPGRIIDDPCPACGGDGVSTRTRTLTVRVPAGVADGQRRSGWPARASRARGGGPAGDLFVVVHVTPAPAVRPVGKNGDDLTLTVPVTFPELALGTTLTVPDAGRARSSLQVPPGTRSGRKLRVRGRGVQRKDGDDRRPARHRRGRGARTTLDDAAQRRCSPTPRPRRRDDPRADLLGGRR